MSGADKASFTYRSPLVLLHGCIVLKIFPETIMWSLSLKNLTLDRNRVRHLCQTNDFVKLIRFRNPTPARKPLFLCSGCGLPVCLSNLFVIDLQLAVFDQR